MRILKLMFIAIVVFSATNSFAQGKSGCGTAANPCIGVSGLDPSFYYQFPDLMLTEFNAAFTEVQSSSFPERLVFEIKIKNIGSINSKFGDSSGINSVVIMVRLVELSETTQQWPFDIEVIEKPATTCSVGLSHLGEADSSADGALWTIAPGEEVEYNFFCPTDTNLIGNYKLIAAFLKVDSSMSDLPTNNNILISPIRGL